ncbi:uncharacterized protein LOC108115783 [Drosophila eugracilis]|uniref:uncharacterized protein LOC108115783 n=1 Tax=Drosophila eugracilis TaxID=29029 RepID=UPI0007E5C125|nr:uncharacterized protein LOC108115783 [Drosophila eugracilis]
MQKERVEPGEHRICGLGNHKLRTPNYTIRNPHLLKFGQRINSELRSQPLCMSCYKNLISLYRIKNNNAKRHKEFRNAPSVSSVSSSRSQTSDTSAGATSVAPASTRAATTTSSEDNDDRQTTSAAAAAKRARRELMSEDDSNSDLSLNAVNGTRLPNIQPIPRRRQFVHLNKEAMEIYLAGTTGG